LFGLNWINGFHGDGILSFLPGVREWRARKKILRRHRRDSGLIVSIEVGWSGSGNAIFIIVWIGEPEDYVFRSVRTPVMFVKAKASSTMASTRTDPVPAGFVVKSPIY